MSVSRLAITHLRNLDSMELSPGPATNIIVGPNGSGKTSILESIHLLGRARSFLTSKHRSLVQRGEKSCTVFGQLKVRRESSAVSVGVTRATDGACQIKVAGDTVRSAAPLAELLPLQVINPGSFALLDGGPKSRRQFVDWGVFHVEHTFFERWQRLNRCLKQRNKLLRRGDVDPDLMAPWDREFLDHSLEITEQRRRYVELLSPLFNEVLSRLSALQMVKLSFYPGWEERHTLEQVMQNAIERDRKHGFTHFGPQRAELRVRYLDLNAAETLSRGQQKLVICALKIAQGDLFTKTTGRPCVYLIDDLAAELDGEHRKTLCRLLSELDSQLFITSVENDAFADCWKTDQAKMFHVKQGVLINRGS